MNDEDFPALVPIVLNPIPIVTPNMLFESLFDQLLPNPSSRTDCLLRNFPGHGSATRHLPLISIYPSQESFLPSVCPGGLVSDLHLVLWGRWEENEVLGQASNPRKANFFLFQGDAMAWICAMGENDIAGKPGSF
jgi:hypothetical protein